MLNWHFKANGAENAIYVCLIRKTMGDIDSGKNCPAAQLEKAAVVDPSLIWPGAAPGDHGGRCLPGGYNYRQFRICIWGLERWDFLVAAGPAVCSGIPSTHWLRSGAVAPSVPMT